MTDSARARIFAAVRRGSAGADADKIARELASFGRAPSAKLPTADICTAFLANVLKNQGSIGCVPNRSGAVKAVAEYLYEHFRSLRLVAGNDPHLAAMPWREAGVLPRFGDRKSTRLNSSHDQISYAVFCLKTKNRGNLRRQI